MTHRYFPHTPDDIARMLGKCGMASLDELYADVPPQLRLKPGGYDLQPSMSEESVRARLEGLAAMNKPLVCFAGAGFYDHYAPSVIAHLLSRSEYLTAYTPYQPEISQGTLQYIFEYQTMMAELTGLDVSNASMYDGTTAVAEAMLMMVASARKRNRVLVSATLLPACIEVVRTYARYHGVKLDTIPEANGVTDLDAMGGMLAVSDVAGVILPSPNRYGILEDLSGVADRVHAHKALLAITSPASMLGVIRSQGSWGADIAAGEAQSLGMPLNYGGPGLGYMCCTQALMRKLPGRIVGATADAKGQRTFVLTLQAREQHIRREKATSNICSNQGLMALYAGIYLSLMGPGGLREVNAISAARTRQAVEALTATGLFELKYPSHPYLMEAALVYSGRVPLKEARRRVAEEYGILAGTLVDDDPKALVICATERRTPAEIKALAAAFTSINS